MAVGALAGARDTGVAVPGELSVIAMHHDQLADYVTPRLTAVALPLKRLGAEGVELALAMANGGQPRHITLHDEPKLVTGSSTAPPAAR
jgi:LacI family transcriptional regulator